MAISRTLSRTSRLADMAIVCFVGFASGIALMHLLRPDYTPASHMISDYAVGPWGAVMTASFACASLGCLALAAGMAKSAGAAASRLAFGLGWLVTGLFAIAALGLTVTAIFPTDLQGQASTRSGQIHELSFMVNVLSIVLAAIGTAALSFGDSRWRMYRAASFVLALMLLFALVLQFKTLHRGMPYGLANRFFVAVLVTWLVSTALALKKARQDGPLGESG